MTSNTRLVLVALISGAAGSLLTTLVTGPGRNQTPPVPVVDFSHLNQRLDRLIQVVEQRPPAVGPVTGNASRPPVDRRLLNESDTVAALEQEIEDLRALVLSQSPTAFAPAVEVSRISQNYPETNWEAVQEVRSRLSSEYQSTVSRDHLFLTRADVLRKYGRPMKIRTRGNGQTIWDYKIAAQQEAGICVVFADGYVIQLYIPVYRR